MNDLEPQIRELRDSSRRMVQALGFLSDDIVECGLSAAQCHALMELARRGRLSSAELAKLLEVDKSTMSRAMRPLVDRGLVDARSRASDRRSRPFELSERGRAKLAEIHRSADAQVGRALSTLSAQQQSVVLEGVRLYERALHRAKAHAEVQIRPIEPSDNPKIAQVIRSVMTEFGAVGSGFSIEDPDVDDMYGAYGDARAAYFVAQKGERFLGGAGIAALEGGQSDVCELKKMYIVPAGRGLGVGKALLDRSLDAARRAGFKRCYLETLGHMTQARHLYEKGGFRRIDAPMGHTGHFSCDHWYMREL
ncbi:MAG TPA: bifunctional helix-turn-helix transcriptional regulator/GNAT family N-acetyltransferase [Candidatus Krumholzibacteria bacterium]|jgi:putative acetyltransferase